MQDDEATIDSVTYHFSPDFISLLIDTIPVLVKTKNDTIAFFRGAGVAGNDLVDVEGVVRQDRSSISKYEIVRRLLFRINEAGDRGLGARRAIVGRLVSFDVFESTCYPENLVSARGFVARVREVVARHDGPAKEQREKERIREQMIAERRRIVEGGTARKATRDAIRRDLYALFTMESHARGKELESVLNRLFMYVGIGVREAFTLTGKRGEGIVEQIDGVIEFDGELYLVEAKWLAHNIGPPELQELIGKIFTRGSARGLFIAEPGYTPAAITTATQVLGQKVVVLSHVREIFTLFEAAGENTDPDVEGWLKHKVHAAIVDRNPHTI